MTGRSGHRATWTHRLGRGVLATLLALLTLATAGSPAAAPTVPSITIADLSLAEGTGGTTAFEFRVTLSETSSKTVSVGFETANGSATSPSDYAEASGKVTFAAGELAKTVAVQVSADGAAEADETFFVRLSGAKGAIIADGEAAGTIVNDDTQPALSINDISVGEGNGGSTNAVFTVSLSSAAPAGGVTFDVATANGTASAPDDYASTTVTGATIPAGSSLYSFTVPVVGDTMFEGNETFLANVTNVVGAAPADGQGQATVVNDDAPPGGGTFPTLSIDDVSHVEGNFGTTAYVFTVTLAPASNAKVTVSFATQFGTASPNVDYQPASGTLTFKNGQTSKAITVLVKGDTTSEPDETFSVRLANAVNAMIGDGEGQGTILNDDNNPPTDIALSNSSVAENQPVGTTVGTLSATDPDAGDTHTFTLVAGTGDTDNASFQITGSTLKTNAVFDYEAQNSYSVRIRATDNGGLTYEEAFTITVTDVVENAAPTDIQLSNSTVAENQLGGTNVGTLTTTDPDAGDTHTYSLVAGAGSDDNAKFQISGSTLQTAVPLDFEADSSLSVRIRTSDGSAGYEEAFTITVTDANDAPIDIALSNSTVAENQPAGTNVGSLSATDQDAGATHTFALVAGSGDGDNAKFQISGSTLQTAVPLDADAGNSLSVRVRADDGFGGTFEKSFTITVTDVGEPPTDIALSNSSVAENEPVGTTVGTLSATDPDAGDTHTFALVAGVGDTDNGSFTIDGSTLKTNAGFDYETKSSYSIRVRATDSGSLTFEEQFTISITNANEPPTEINLSNSSVAENQPAGTAVGTLTTVDDPGSTHTYTLVGGAGDTDNTSFQIDGETLESAAVFDVEVKSSYSIRVRTDDGTGGTFERQFTITITNANDAPTDIALSNASVNENEASGTNVGTLSATDQDAGDTHAFSLVSGAGDTDNVSFQITGSTLKTNVAFNYEVKNSYSIRVRVTDSGSATHEEQFTIAIVDANDAPVAVADSYGNAVGNTQAVLGTSGSGPHIALTGNVLTNNDTDEDTTLPHTVAAVAETVASTGGGSATIAADGSFTFLPGVGDKNQVDTFTYHVTDGALTSAGTVSVTIANVLVWYVNASAGAGDGRSSSPLNSLAAINGAGGTGDADTTGDIIFLYSGTYGGGLPLEVSQKLTGQPHGLSVNPGSGTVTLLAAGGTNPTIGNSAGAGIGLANSVEVQRVNVNGTSGAGVTGTSVTNATIGGNTSIGGATGNAFELSGAASGTIDVGSTISSSTARSVSVQGRTGGSVNLTGNVTDTGQGVLLNSNTGATVNLTGSLTISTGSNAGFTATGGGTVNANTASNTIATTTGTALNVQNTTIGSSGLTFRSIASNGAASGIVLNNTGATAGLTVTGNGAAGTGGTIQNSSGAGILLTSTRAPSFSWMVVQNGGDDGIRGSSVVNFTLANSTVSNNGNAVNESGLDFVGGLTGAASISSSTVNTYAENGMIVTNTSGSLNLTVTGSSFLNASAATGNDGIHLDANNTASVTASVTGSTFDNNRGDHFQFSTNASSSGINSVTYSSNTLTGDRGAPFGDDLGAGITISTTGSSDTAFTLANNNIQGAVFPTIGIDIGTSSTAGATLSGTVSSNTIGNAVVAASGGAQSSAIALVGQGAGTLTAAVTNNTIRQNDGFAAIDILSRDGSPTINATVTGNNVANPSAGGGNGVLLRNGAVTTDGGFTCAAITGNSLAGSAALTFDDFRLRQRFNTTVRLPGYSGGAGDTAAVVAFVQANNPGAESGSATADFPATGGGFVGGAACPTP